GEEKEEGVLDSFSPQAGCVPFPFSPRAGRRWRVAPDEGPRALRCSRGQPFPRCVAGSEVVDACRRDAKSAPHPPSAPSPRKRGEGKESVPRKWGEGKEKSMPFSFSPQAGRRWRVAPDEGPRALRCSRWQPFPRYVAGSEVVDVCKRDAKSAPHPPSAPSPRKRGEGKERDPRTRGEGKESVPRKRGEGKEKSVLFSFSPQAGCMPFPFSPRAGHVPFPFS